MTNLGYLSAGVIICAEDAFELREVITPFGNADRLDSENSFFWNKYPALLIGQFLHEN
jgi:hypothetical protein